MSCGCLNEDFCIDCCDTVNKHFEQCGAVWPTGITSVSLDIFTNGCSGAFHVAGTYTNGPPSKAEFKIGPDVSCSLPKGHRSCDYKVIAVNAAGERFTIKFGRISVR